MTINLTSNAVVNQSPANYPVWIVQAANPETLLAKWLRDFFVEMRFEEIYPQFGKIRIGNVHPFAMLLFQDVQGQKLDLSVFPSITISDSTESENYVTLGRDAEAIPIDARYVAELNGYISRGDVMVAPSAYAYLKAATNSGNTVYGIKTDYRGSHRIDINIWCDNKTVGGVIFDMVKAFINSRRGDLHQHGIDIVDNMDGRRSGDISVEFGVLLFGSNLTIPCVIDAGALRVELPWSLINSVVIEPYYHAGEYVDQLIPVDLT